MPDPNRRITELPKVEAPLSATRAVIIDGVGGESGQACLQDIVAAGLRLTGLPSQLQKVDPVSGVPDLPAPSNPTATLGPLTGVDIDPLDGIPVIRRNPATYPVPVVEQVQASKIAKAVPSATPFVAGMMAAVDKANLDALVAGGVNALPNQLTMGRILTGPVTTTLDPTTDAGLVLQCNASAGDIIINVPANITTPALKRFVGAISKRGTGKVIFQSVGIPQARPTILGSDVFKLARGNNTDPMTTGTRQYTHTVPNGGANCVTYFFLGALPNATGAASGTMGLAAAIAPALANTGPVAWAKSDYPDVGSVEPFGHAVFVGHKVWGTLAADAVVNIDLAVSDGWRSYMLFAITLKDVPQLTPLEALLTETLSVQVAAASVSPDIVVPKANQVVLSAAYCRSGSDAAASIVVTGATQQENDNTSTSGTVSTHTRGALASEDGSIGVISDTFTFPSAQPHGYAIATVPAIEASAVALIVPGNGPAELTGVNQYYGWTYDGNANELEVI